MSAAPIEFTLNPITSPAAFAGRHAETRLMISRASQPIPPLQSLEGPSKIGRTSMLHYLRAVSRGDIEHHPIGRRGPRLVAPYIDLALHPHRDTTAQDVILEAIVSEMGHHHFPVPALASDLSATSAVAASMATITDDGYRFLLLVDHVEHLLTTPRSEDALREVWSDSATAVLGELNERVSIAVLLAFGSTGPAKELQAQARRLRMLETLDALSQILNRGNATRTTLGLLEDTEIRGFAEQASVPGVAGRGKRLTAEEVDWIAEVAGGHPLIMQNAGTRLVEVKGTGDLPHGRAELERQLADPGLQPFLVDAFRRIGAIDRPTALLLRGLAAGNALELAPDLMDSLLEEGLIRRTADDRPIGMMPSRALRLALSVYVNALDMAGHLAPAEPAPQAHARIPSPNLVVRSGSGALVLRLTRSEHALIKRLLQAEDDEAVPRSALKAALGPATEDHQLTQRMSVLRSKISATLGITDAIENRYGVGYRLIRPARFELRDRP